MSKITIEVKAPELASAIEKLATALGGKGTNITLDTAVKVPTKEVVKSTKTAKKVEKTESKTADVDPIKKEQPTVKLTEVRAKLTELSREDAKGLVAKYGAKKLSDIDPDNYAALIADAEAI